jgi:alanyl-tRNA synthetase
VRRIEAVTGRGAYDLIARRFKALKQTASLLRSSVDEVPRKVESLQDEIANLRKQLADMRNEMAHSRFSGQAENIRKVGDVNVLAMEVPNADANALRSLSDKFREKYPKESIAVLASGSTIIAAVTNDVVARGIKAGDLITAIGGRGGGRPNMAQGSLPDPSKVDEVLEKVTEVVQEKLR